jgi:hypothetical protein
MTLAILAVVLVAAASVVQAQTFTEPVVACGNFARYDVNHDGVVNQFDMEQWIRVVHESGALCRLGDLVGQCPAWVDLNGDGFITHADVDMIGSYIRNCLQPRRNTLPPW